MILTGSLTRAQPIAHSAVLSSPITGLLGDNQLAAGSVRTLVAFRVPPNTAKQLLRPVFHSAGVSTVSKTVPCTA